MVSEKKGLKTYIYIISDSTGETAQLVARAAISQFSSDLLKIKLFAHIESIKDIKGILEKIEKNNSIIVYTLIKPDLRRFLREESEKNSVNSFDIMGPIIENIEKLNHDERRECERTRAQMCRGIVGERFAEVPAFRN